MPLMNPDPLRYPGSAPTTGGTPAQSGASTQDASAWIQQQPWYRQTLASWGNPPTLSLGQRGYLARTAIQAGMNPSFGINTDGSVEDWSTPTGSKIALAAFAAWAAGAGMGAFGPGGGFGASSSATPTLEASMNATSAPSGGIPAAFGQTAVDTTTSAAGGTPSWLVPALKAATPIAITAAMRPGGNSNGAGANGLSGDQNNLLTQLIQMSLQRQQASAPVHDAAMKLALGLAPTSNYGDSPRFQQAVQQTTGPGPQASPNPQVTAAMQRLMGRG